MLVNIECYGLHSLEEVDSDFTLLYMKNEIENTIGREIGEVYVNDIKIESLNQRLYELDVEEFDTLQFYVVEKIIENKMSFVIVVMECGLEVVIPIEKGASCIYVYNQIENIFDEKNFVLKFGNRTLAKNRYLYYYEVKKGCKLKFVRDKK